MKQKRKYFNLRLFFIGFLGMVLGILNFYNLYNLIWLDKLSIWLIVFSFLFLTTIALLVVCSVKITYRKFLKYLIIFCLLFLIGGGLFSIELNSMRDYKDFGEDCNIVGEVKSHYYKNNYYFISLSDVIINGESIDGELKLYVVLDAPISDELSLGDKIFVSGDVSFKPLVTDKINIAHYVADSVYSSNVTASGIEITNQQPDVIQFLQMRLRRVLNQGLTKENADIAYGVLVGDKEELDQSVTETFSYAGISHILAVSGLHVGFLVGLLTFVLNLCKVGRRKRFFIISSVLILYSIFCGLTASILRASFMTIVLLLAGVLGEEYDGINSLGVAGILILLLFPTQVFSIGFQLSFMCVFMIMTLADKFNRLLLLWHIPQSVASAISVSLCVTIGSSIIVANTLSEVSLISIVANLIIIPLFSVIFPMLFVMALISMMIPALSGVLFMPQFLLHLVKLIANFFAGINFAHFRIFNLGYLLLLVFVILAILIKFFMAKKVIKYPICIILAAICVGLVVFGAQEREYNMLAVHTNYQYGTNSVLITTENNKKYLIGIDEYSTMTFLTEMKINSLDAVVMQDFEISKIDSYTQFFQNMKVDRLIIPEDDRYYYEMFEAINKYVVVESVDKWEDEISVEFINSDNVVAGAVVSVRDKTMLFPSSISKEKLGIIADEINYADYIYTNTSKYDFRSFGIDYDKIIHSKDLKFETNDAISLKNKSHYVIEL